MKWNEEGALDRGNYFVKYLALQLIPALQFANGMQFQRLHPTGVFFAVQPVHLHFASNSSNRHFMWISKQPEMVHGMIKGTNDWMTYG